MKNREQQRAKTRERQRNFKKKMVEAGCIRVNIWVYKEHKGRLLEYAEWLRTARRE